MNELLTTMPELQNIWPLAKNSSKRYWNRKNYTRQHHFSYLAVKELGLNEDIRKESYNAVNGITMSDLVASK
jgi:hypothetical protein